MREGAAAGEQHAAAPSKAWDEMFCCFPPWSRSFHLTVLEVLKVQVDNRP